MNTTTWLLVLLVVAGSVGGAVFYYRKKNKDLLELFVQIAEMSRQIPQQKKQSFVLLMFKESVRAAKAKSTVAQGRLSDPRQLEAQLVQMGSILKDRSKVTDKQMKQALQMLDSYMKWEKGKAGKTDSKTKPAT